ncbi:MAG: 2-dehydro-3-deoxy-D-gluconate 5-dehydrogenase KduD [Spirochaetaceae bacterium]|jgi:2-deoxy-D-gluconate 3-dehydrogenase|nr:2-dehydro-3-deoxy-D-gluconate 5-dehydrogenase KduD [Spirochaetaceae bacterium]
MSITDLFRLDGKAALVTGAGRGLGQGIAKGLAEAGADIFGTVFGSTESAVAETRAFVEKAGRRFEYCSVNLTAQDCIPTIFEEMVKQFGRVDIVVNNAGIIRREDSVNFTEADWDDVININLKSVFFIAQMAARHFIAHKTRGKIINIASMLSYQGGIRVPSYTASKGAILTLTMLMANEWARYGINANAIAPGYMVTDNTAALRADPVRSAAILERIPAGRWGSAQDIAGAAVFLASPASDYVNGFTLAVDGGWLAR